jgi:DNA modification methylase
MLIRGDARALPLRDGCVACVVTSPPYWGLRDYGVRGQIGLEQTPEQFVSALVEVFREVRRVLKEDGTAWVNLGDSYAHSLRQSGVAHAGEKQNTSEGSIRSGFKALPVGMKEKDLVGVPWRVAFALQADGWYLRSDIIWSKPNPMPESVTDRPTKAHEYLFLLSKRATYYYDAEAVKEPHATGDRPDKWEGRTYDGKGPAMDDGRRNGNVREYRLDPSGRNKRSVWHIATQPYAGAHFATMPEPLIAPCILAGCPPGGLVLDPFCGTGTVGAVASRLGRRWVGVDLTYQALARTRTAQRGLLFTEASASCP